MIQTDAAPNPRLALRGMLTACWRTRAISEAVRFGLIDAMATGPKSGAGLAEGAGLHPEATGRLVRALCTLDVCRQHGPDSFGLGELGEPLRSDSPASLKGFALHWGGRMWDSFTNLEPSLRSGGGAMASDPAEFAAMQANPEQAAVFNRAMAEQSVPVARALAKAYDFSGFREVMDVGGGYGSVLATLLGANPGLGGAVFDLPVLKDGAEAYLAKAGVGDRGRFLGGSFFESVPTGADCLVLKYIIHDWNDANSAIILKRCREAVDETGVMLLIEQVVPEIVTADPVQEAMVRTDLVMMAVDGKERTEAQYRALLTEAGWRLTRIVRIDAGFSAIEARPT